MPRLVVLLLLAGPCVAAAKTLADTEPARLADYVITAWTAKDGLQSDVIWSVTQDHEGYLWLGTNGGLVRFDGVRFVHVEGRGGTALIKAPVRTVYAGRDSIWIGYSESGGISRLQGSTVTTYGEADGLPRAVVAALLEDQDGTVWASTLRGLYKFTGKRWQLVGSSAGLPEVKADGLYLDRAGTLVVGTAAGVFQQRRGAHSFELVDALNDVGPAFRGISEDREGRIWLTDPVVGFRKLGEHVPAHRAGERGRGNRLLFDREGDLWVATMGEGLWRIRRQSLGKLEAIEKTRISGARTLFEDRDGNIWAGAGDGLVRLRKPPVSPVENLGLVEAVAATADGRVWAATADGLLAFTRLPDGNRDRQRSVTGTRVRAIKTDPQGALWAATDGGLLHLSDRDHWYRPAAGATILSRTIALAPDAGGGLWLASRDGGAWRWHPRQPQLFEPVTSLAGVRLTLIFGDSGGRLWFATAAGRVGTFEPGSPVRYFGPADGLDSGSYLSVYEDSRSVIWVGGFDGLHRMVGDRFIRFDQANRFRGAVSGIMEDSEGDLWLATASGIIAVTRQALDESLQHPGVEVRTSLFDIADGTAGMPISFGGPSVARAADGRIWFLTGRGLTSLEPGALKRPRAPAVTKIESVHVDERSVDATPGVQLPGQTTRLQIDYTALDLTTPLRTSFRYRLEGFDAEWIEAGTRRQALYTHLPPRDYRFHVVASTSDGSWGDAAAVWDFSIRPRFYQTYWFATLCLLATGVTTWTIWRLHVRGIRRQFAALLGERVRLSRDLHDTLLQSLVGVALQFDGVASGLDANSPARAQLVRIRKHVEEYIREARASIWHLRAPRLESGDLAAALRESAERATAGAPVELAFSLHTPAGWSPEDTDEQLLRICHEAVLNAVRHADASRVTVTLRCDDDTIVLRIADNGHGFDPSLNAEIGENGHYGLLSMRERAEQAGGHLSLTTAPNEGTVVEARVPLRA